jgi:hypothetical protein
MTRCLVNHLITGNTVFVLVPTETVMMCPTIDNLASCEFALLYTFFALKTSVMRIFTVNFARFKAKI